MAAPLSYLLCGTPRTGSTLLCSLLSSTGLLGHPESYFRKPDEAAWASHLDVPVVDGRVADYPSFVRAVRAAGTTENGVFAARIMWGSIEGLVEGGGPCHESELAALESALGPVAFVFLRREDTVAQAVSWARAEQTGFWHEGDPVLRPPKPHAGQLVNLHSTIREHNAAWDSWFDHHDVTPYRVTYEGLVRNPRGAVEGIAAALGVSIPGTWRPQSRHRKQADEINHQWEAMLRTALATGSREDS